MLLKLGASHDDNSQLAVNGLPPDLENCVLARLCSIIARVGSKQHLFRVRKWQTKGYKRRS